MKARYTDLQRGLKSRHISLIALGGIIGSSYFLGNGYVINQIGPGAFLAYALGGLISFITIACLAELTIAVPMPGSFVSYASKFISPSWACGVGWSYWVSWMVYIPSECIAAGILMHNYLPVIPEYGWTMIFGILITLINFVNVKAFGEAEFWLSLVKITLLVGFSILAVLIFCGVIGTHERIGLKYLLESGGLFPNGYMILLFNMVVLLSNFQGSEIIGLSAAESEEPAKAIPSALKKMTFRIIALYLIPTFLIVLIYPWNQANLKGSIFAFALEKYHLDTLGHIFSFLIIAGAISCANSGLYATVRSLYALSKEKMAPQSLTYTNEYGVPVRATLMTLGSVWFLIFASYFFSAHSLYANLLAMSGFTGTMCWISICWSQFRFRKGINTADACAVLPFRMKGFPYLTLIGIWAQVICLAVVVFSPELRTSFYIGVPVLVLPIIFYHLKKKINNL